MPSSSSAAPPGTWSERIQAGVAYFELPPRLDAGTVGPLWKQIRGAIARHASMPVIVDALHVEYCDGAGIAMLVDLLRQPRPPGAPVEVRQLPAQYRAELDRLDPARFRAEPAAPPPRRPFTERVGRVASQSGVRVFTAIAFIGQLVAGLAEALMRPGRVRWADTVLIAQRAGMEALPIVSLIAFLMGVILAFQSAIALRVFGAEMYVADLVGLSLLRELGPLMTAILLAGRTGAAFAAEIGTMKVNEEVDALITMGLDPVRFLVVPRVLAALAMIPLLTVYADLIGLVGGAAVMTAFEIPLAAYWRETFTFVSLADFLGGTAKSFVFALIIGGVGCLRGLQTGAGPASVGLATTSAVVTALVLIVVADGIFALVYYHLDI
jgi:phospholipid/cholesterol/gamma-HCH transport system permease protein